MKRVMIISFIAFMITSCLLAQVKDSVDVKALVKQQIVEAQQKEKTKRNTFAVVKKAEVKTQNVENNSDDGIAVSTILKVLVLLVASLAASAVIIKRRLKLRKIENRIKLKENVKQLREEQLVRNIDPRLKMIRKKLCLTSSYLNKPEKEIIIAAKKLSIAKEEILLASRLNSYAMRQKMEASV